MESNINLLKYLGDITHNLKKNHPKCKIPIGKYKSVESSVLWAQWEATTNLKDELVHNTLVDKFENEEDGFNVDESSLTMGTLRMLSKEDNPNSSTLNSLILDSIDKTHTSLAEVHSSEKVEYIFKYAKIFVYFAMLLEQSGIQLCYQLY